VLAVIGTVAAIPLRRALDPLAGDTSPYMLFYFPIALAAIVGGLGPGLAALLLGIVAANWLFVPPRGSLGIALPEDLVRFVFFLASGALMSVVGAWARSAWFKQQAQMHRVFRILESMTDAYMALDSNWTITDVNTEAEHLLRAKRQELIGRNFWEKFPDAQHFRVEKERAMRERAPVRLEEFYPGVNKWLNVSAYPSDDGLALFFRDVSLRRERDEALRVREEWFRTFFDLAAVGTILVDPATGRFLQVNDRYCQITGYSREELLGMTVTDPIHPADRAQCERTFERFVRGQPREYLAEKRYLRKNGEMVWVQLAAAMLRDASGTAVRAIAIVQDITDRKLAEQALQERKERLRVLVGKMPDGDGGVGGRR